MGDEDLGARVRAALAYAGLDEPAGAQLLGFSKRTLARIERNERDLTIQEAKRLAEGTGVPLQFLLSGWGEPTIRLAELTEAVEALKVQVAGNVSEVLQLLDAMQQPSKVPPAQQPASTGDGRPQPDAR